MNRFKENLIRARIELKKVVERVGMLEERVKQQNTLKLQVKRLKQKSETTDTNLLSKDVELTLLMNFKKDTLTLTVQLETRKSLRHQKY